jgi:glutathione synthase/RimK-type ligase-like ATP-grasp enzyme
LTVIREAGLRVPETFISNDPAAARRFLAANPDSVYKSVSGIRSIVKEAPSADGPAIDDVRWCPTLFQRVVPGVNYRAHVIGDEILAVRLESSRLDYRYGNTTMVAEALPGDVARKCRALNSMLGLHFSGIDLMRTPDDQWFCFEVNTSPGYSYFECGSGQQISAALARFMIAADRRRRESAAGPLPAQRFLERKASMCV